MMRSVRAFAGLVVLAGLGACSTTPVPVQAGIDTAWHGNLPAGGKFGATIGQPAAGVQDALWAQGYGFEGEETCTTTIQRLFACRSGERYLAFQPLRLDRRGHVYLKIENDHVSQIGWEFQPVAYLDG